MSVLHRHASIVIFTGMSKTLAIKAHHCAVFIARKPANKDT
jgi:hypothetical protein